MSLTFRFCTLAAAFLFASTAARQTAAAESGAAEVGLASLVQAMTNREALARFPSPQFRLRDQSSCDRLSTTPDDAKTWFSPTMTEWKCALSVSQHREFSFDSLENQGSSNRR